MCKQDKIQTKNTLRSTEHVSRKQVLDINLIEYLNFYSSKTISATHQHLLSSVSVLETDEPTEM